MSIMAKSYSIFLTKLIPSPKLVYKCSLKRAKAMTDTTESSSVVASKYSQTFQNVSAVVHVAMRSAQELTHLVAEMHSTITYLPSPLNKEHKPNARFAPFPYRIVASSFALIAKLSKLFTAHQTEFNQPLAIRTQAALNGVCGDKLEHWESPLATPITLRSENGDLLDISNWAQQPAKAHILFLHGLCHSDLEWQQSANHVKFYHELAQLGYKVAWLRYNTGRAIHHNGEAFADLLQQHFAEKGTPLILIGHSMGGLLIRSASHWAEVQQHTWLKRLTHAAYLGSPHLGAPWERVGHKANNLLNITPYTRPLMRLGNIRSRGIKDLRYARLTADNILPHLPESVNHLLLASAWNEKHAENWIGDGIVPVASALAQDEQGDVLSAPKLKRILLNDINHLRLLDDERVYQELRAWLGTDRLLITETAA
jgi:pimeloyl-ACP methyl ester carboxylesterase